MQELELKLQKEGKRYKLELITNMNPKFKSSNHPQIKARKVLKHSLNKTQFPPLPGALKNKA